MELVPFRKTRYRGQSATGMMPMPALTREAFIFDKERLMSHEPAFDAEGYRPGIGGGK